MGSWRAAGDAALLSEARHRDSAVRLARVRAPDRPLARDVGPLERRPAEHEAPEALQVAGDRRRHAAAFFARFGAALASPFSASLNVTWTTVFAPASFAPSRSVFAM